MGWIIFASILFFLFLLLLIPVRIYLSVGSETVLKLCYAVFAFKIMPPKEENPSKKAKNAKKKAKKKAKKDAKEAKKRLKKKAKKQTEKKPAKEKKSSMIKEMAEQDGFTAVLSFFASLARIAAVTVRKILRRVKIRKLCLDVVVASGNAAKTAQSYGQMCEIIYSALPVIDSAFNMQIKEFSIIPDFREKAEQKINFSAVILIRPLFILSASIAFLWAFLVKLLKVKFSSSRKKQSAPKDKKS